MAALGEGLGVGEASSADSVDLVVHPKSSADSVTRGEDSGAHFVGHGDRLADSGSHGEDTAARGLRSANLASLGVPAATPAGRVRMVPGVAGKALPVIKRIQ
jgi:hypothetical protein